MRTKPKRSFVIGHGALASAGLFAARVALEATRRPWPGFVVVTVGLVGALGGLALGRVLDRRHVRLWPAFLLLVYVGWPRRDPAAAASVAVLAALVWLLGGERRSPRRWAEPLADGATFVVALIVYVATAAPDVLPADAGEFQLAAALLGVAHPPGFPLYTMVGHLFIRLFPWGTPAYRLNVMSGVIAAGTLVLAARATRLWARQLGASSLVTLAGGLAAALTLGTATTFWAQATIASKRPLTVFFVALALYALSRFAAAEEARGADRALVLLGLALGLGFGQDALGFASILFVAVYALLVDPRLVAQPCRWWRPALAGLAGLLPLAYLPIRGAMGAVLAPEGLDTLPGFLHHFLGLGFSGDMFAFANAADLPHRLALVPTLFPLQFNVVILAAALFGLLGLLRRDWRLFVLLAGTLVLQTFISITYRAPQTVEYLMPAYPPVAIAAGLLPAVFLTPRPAPGALQPALRRTFRSKSKEPALRRTFRSKSKEPALSLSKEPALSLSKGPFVAAVILWAGLLNGWAHGPSFVELAGDHTARQVVGPLLETAPAGALILADWRWATPLRYLREVEGLRPDVEVRYVYPVTDVDVEYRDVWLGRIEEADPGVPILLTHFYQFDGYTTEPWETGFLIRPQPVTEPAAPLAPVEVTFGDMVHVLGYSLRQDRFHPGQVAEFVLAWQPAAPLERAPSFTLRLVDAQGHHRAQVDRRLGTERAPEEVRFQQLALPLYPTLPPGPYRVILGAYTVTEAGFENLTTPEGETAITLAELELVPLGCDLQSSTAGSSAARQTAAGRAGTVCDQQSTPFTLHRQAVPVSGGPTLVGVDYDRSVPDVLRVYLAWRGPAGEGWQARVRTADGVEAAVPLASIPAGAHQIVGLDLQGAVGDRLWLSLVDGQGGALSSSKGQVGRAAGPWGWSVDEIRLPGAPPDARFVPLGDEMAVVGATAHPAAAGKKMAVDVTLVALRPLTSDDGTSVRLVDGEGRWLATDDCQPALGAIPTLKWIRGSRVVDRHVLPLQGDSTGGEVRATFVAYERFRMTPLSPMDGRFSEVPLGTWPLP